jgi:stage II sporulation protein M
MLLTILPKEIIIIPCIIALGVSGINFSLSIIKNKSIKHITKRNLKTNFLAYSGTTLMYSCLVFAGILVEVYVIPVFLRVITPIINV